MMMNNNFVKGFEILTKSSHNNDFYDFASRHSEQPLSPNFINNHVIASPSGRGNPITATLVLY